MLSMPHESEGAWVRVLATPLTVERGGLLVLRQAAERLSCLKDDPCSERERGEVASSL